MRSDCPLWPGRRAASWDACDDVLVSDDLPGICLVTGASRGIGRLLAVHLARAGIPVVAVARPSSDLEALSGVAETLTVRPADVSDPATVRALFSSVAHEVGPPTTVITCAGSIDALGPVADVDPDRWWSAVAVDLRGAMLTAQAALKAMLPLQRGRIVTVYGNLGDRGTPNLSAFAVAKAGIARFTETLANEVHGTGVMVIGMHPGFVRTPMTEHLAQSDAGRRWVPGFGTRAAQNWGNGDSTIGLLDQIMAGETDELAGRIVHAGQNVAQLAAQIAAGNDAGHLRLQF